MVEIEWIDNLGKNLRRERKSWGMSLRRLARLSHIDKESIEEIERGINKNPDFFDMLNICEVLDSSVYFYIKRKKRKNKRWKIKKMIKK